MRVELLQRGAIADQDLIAVDEGNGLGLGTGVLRIGQPLGVLHDPHDPHVLGEKCTEPLRRRLSLIQGRALIIPDSNGYRLLSARAQLQDQWGLLGGSQHERIARDLRHQQRQLRMSALTQELAAGIDGHPVAVPLEAGGSHPHVLFGDPPGGLERIDEQLLDLTLHG